MGKKSERREQRIAAARDRGAAPKLGGGTAGPLSHFHRVVKALTMAAPICLALRYEDGLNHCIEASVCGAQVLARWQIAARVVQCAAVAVHRRNPEIRLSTGLTHRQIYDRIQWGDLSVLPYETWKDQNANWLPSDELTTHAVIEASSGDDCVLIDLTIGQLRKSPILEAKTIPWQIVLTDGPFTSPDWVIAYNNALHSQDVMAEVDALIEKFSDVGFVEDLHDLIKLALHYDLDGSRFYAEFKRQQPKQYVTAMSQIARLGGL